jgi:hypothetical protein
LNTLAKLAKSPTDVAHSFMFHYRFSAVLMPLLPGVGFKKYQMVSNGIRWFQLVSECFSWYQNVSVGIHLFQTVICRGGL